MANIKPQFDRFEDDPPCAPDVERTRRQYAVQQFFADCGDEWFAGTDDCNAITLRNYLEVLERPVTRRNLMIAWRELNENGFLEKPFDLNYNNSSRSRQAGTVAAVQRHGTRCEENFGHASSCASLATRSSGNSVDC